MHLNLKRITATLHEHIFIISRSVFLRMRNVSDVVEKIKTHVLYSITFFFFENPTVNVIIWKNNLQPAGQRLWLMRISRLYLKLEIHTQNT